ncbi:MAG: extracellular solute-binding protein [Aquamicrobium sp.]|uniref:extracellular solute-binding protein n=1 Tax=Aquamicrobium sp. TaxID=1872579 RepID=UPI00349EB0E6|nr:extracellular solute-binding protein [Aquamicrobium sp.]MCO5155538.1 extracellular solute-binding protein [Aquamicrobium sp.]
MIRLRKRSGIEEYALDHLSGMDTAGLISRRELLRRSAVFGAAATLGTFTGVLRATAQTTGGKVTVGLDSGAYTPILQTFAPEFREATGIEVEFVSYPLGNMYDQNLLALRQTEARFDAFDFWPNFTGDFGPFLTPLEEVGTLEDLGFADIARPFQLLNMYENKLVGVMIDGDMFVNTIRTDLFEDGAEMAAFKAKYGYDLAAPTNWQQYRDTAEFFTRPDQNLFGAVEVTNFFVYAFFINQVVQLGAERGVRYGELFDEQMKPKLLNEIGIEALTRYKEVTNFMPADLAASMPWDVGRQVFFEGRIAQANWWTDMPKGAADSSISQVSDKIKVARSWGDVTVLPYGRAMGIAANSKNKEGAFRAIAWLQQSANANRWVAETFAQSLMDPWRMSMFNDPASTFPLHAKSGFGDNFAEVSKAALSNPKAYLDISIPGTNRYLGAIIQHTQRAVTGQATPEEALGAMEAEWEETTETYGRDRQIGHYQEYVQRLVAEGYWS